MNARNLLILTGAAVLAAITVNLNAGDALLSPRAKDNQIRIVSGTTDAQPARNAQLGSPRALGNQTKIVKGVESVNLTASKCNVVGSPKAAMAGSCCGSADSKCAKTFACCETH